MPLKTVKVKSKFSFVFQEADTLTDVYNVGHLTIMLSTVIKIIQIYSSATISAHSVVYFLLYQDWLVLYFSTRKECCSHDYHVVVATQEHNDNSSLSLPSLTYLHSLTFF